MILNNAPQNEAVLSNVGEIGEFRIRNSAKAFNILSSGLYANKIRAIIRELSCNAVDSHVAAGKADVKFEIHLPNSLDPFFSIRDFGTGLTHDQVTNIYTTYFESTKTDSNAFIGALGLGSKSPFSYTDNFTVTAIKDGKRGIYSAFINGEGVPSIALMMTEETDEPAGVEIKFSVNDRYDFSKFRDEAQKVFRHFKLKPKISGCSEFHFEIPAYESRNIIPGVHIFNNFRRSVAVMGNIEYPIEVPNEKVSLGNLRHMLECGLEMHFEIGELDFQASREGLSYIPETVAAIKRKLEAVYDQLFVHIKNEADKIDNLWLRAIFLAKKQKSSLWKEAVDKYATDTKLPTYDFHTYGRLAKIIINIDALAKDFNIVIRGVHRTRGSRTMTNLKPRGITVDENTHFVINDTKVGALERVKNHYRESMTIGTVFVIEAADKNKDIDTAGFFASIHNPPENNIFKASALTEKPRKNSSLGKSTTTKIFSLVSKKNWNSRYSEETWVNVGEIESLDMYKLTDTPSIIRTTDGACIPAEPTNTDFIKYQKWLAAGNTPQPTDAKTEEHATKTYYYVTLSGFQMQSKFGVTDAKELKTWLRKSGISGLTEIEIYGVRKGNMEEIKRRTNWVNLEDHIVATLQSLDKEFIKGMLVVNKKHMQYDSYIVEKITDPNSPYAKLISEFKGVEKAKINDVSFRLLCRHYGSSMIINPETEVAKYKEQFDALSQRYPLLQYIYGATEADIADYINLIDKSL